MHRLILCLRLLQLAGEGGDLLVTAAQSAVLLRALLLHICSNTNSEGSFNI